MTTQVYELTLKVFCPFNPDETNLADSGVVIDAECGGSIIVHRSVRLMTDTQEIIDQSGEFFAELVADD
jgi:hypothetical protein